MSCRFNPLFIAVSCATDEESRDHIMGLRPNSLLLPMQTIEAPLVAHS